jgi:uncharacterized protein (DUF1499 family)
MVRVAPRRRHARAAGRADVNMAGEAGGGPGGQRSWAAVIAAALGVLGLFDALVGPLLIHAGMVSPIFGFQYFFGLGLLEGLLGLLVGLVALFRTRAGPTRGSRPLAWVGVLCGGLLTAFLVFSIARSGRYPPINDITTNLQDPPAFASDPSGRGRDMAYPPSFVPQVKAAYPDLQPLHTSAPPAEALARAEQTARSLGWQVVQVDPADGTLVARDVSRVFEFVDDIVVRVRPLGTGSVVDVRSKSRDGKGDLGANARRIRAFLQRYPR